MPAKRIMYKLLTMLFALSLNFNSSAQVTDCDPNGKDSVLTLRSYSLMHEDVKLRYFEGAKENWLYVFNNAPCFREQTYVDGVAIYLNEINTTSYEIRRKELIDTLNLIYQNRLKYFGGEGKVKGMWGKDLLELYPNDPEPGLVLIEESIALEGNKLDNTLIVPYFKTITAMEKKGQRSSDNVLETYALLAEIIEFNRNNKTGVAMMGLYKSPFKLANLSQNTFTIDKPGLLEVGVILTFTASYSSQYTITNIDSIYVTVNKPITEKEGSTVFYIKEAWTVAKENLNSLAAPYLDCQILSDIYAPKFDEDPSNTELQAKMLLFLNNAGCTNSLYFKVAEANLKANPSAQAYRSLAFAYGVKKNYAQALSYYQKAVELESDKDRKADDYLSMARIALSSGKGPQAKIYAEKALNLVPKRGEAYLLIGDSYLLAAGKCTQFDKNAIYWVVVDQYIKAKNTDPGIAGAANRRIAAYSPYFPKKADAFFYGITVGKTYTLKCYPNLSTQVRFVD